MNLFSVHTVEFSYLGLEVFHHPSETWDTLLEHAATDFRDCPDVQELWLCTCEEDQVMIWDRSS